MAKRQTPDPHARVRKIAEWDENSSVTLTKDELDEQRAKVCTLRDKQDALDDELAGIKAQYKAKSGALEEEERVARRMVSTGKRDAEIHIEEFLTQSNEVIRIRSDTQEMVATPRLATPRELQEELPLDGGDEDDGFGRGS